MNNLKRGKYIVTIFLIGVPLFLFCTLTHLCMRGHMAHPPYPTWHFINDWAWISIFVLCVVGVFRLDMRRKRWFLYGVFLLIISRMILESLGGGGMIFEVPLLLYLTLVSISLLIKPERYINL